MPLQHDDLAHALHRIGSLYWHRPDTADCLVRVIRLCSCQHVHRGLQPRVRRGTEQSRSELSWHSAPTSATALTNTFQLDDGFDCSRYPRNAHERDTLSNPQHCKDADEDTLKKRPKHDDACYDQHDPDKKWNSRTEVSECSPVLANHSSPSRTPFPEYRSPRASDPKRMDPAGVPRARRDTRRESAPSSMCDAPSSTRTASRRCAYCCSSSHDQDPEALVFLLHKDFLTTQSVLFRELLRADNFSSFSATSKRPGDIAGSSREAACDYRGRQTCITLALPDPGSFDVLVEYLYMGDFSKLAAAMDSGIVRWENVMLNAQHLGLSPASKMQLGAWWRLRQGRPLQQKVHRASLPPFHTSHPAGSSAALMQFKSTAARPRAYTTGSGQQAGPQRTTMTPSHAIAALTNTAARPAARERKRSRDSGVAEGEATVGPHNHGSSASPLQHEARLLPHRHSRSIDTVTSTSTPVLGTRGFASSALSLRAPSSPSEANRLDGKGEHRPSAVRQLLLGGARRRALSNLAYYCSAETSSNMAAPVKP